MEGEKKKKIMKDNTFIYNCYPNLQKRTNARSWVKYKR